MVCKFQSLDETLKGIIKNIIFRNLEYLDIQNLVYNKYNDYNHDIIIHQSNTLSIAVMLRPCAS